MQTTEFRRAFQRPPPVDSMGKYRRRFSRDKIDNTLAQTSIIYILSPFISIIVLIISGLFMKIHIFINTTKEIESEGKIYFTRQILQISDSAGHWL